MNHPLYAVLLAAGESTRMSQLKALLPWEGQTLLRYGVDQLLALPLERLVVVLGHRADELRALLPDAEPLVAVENAGYRNGKVSSILAGMASLPRAGHVLVLSVDQPRPAELLSAVARQHLEGEASITIAAYGDRRGHPVVFAPPLFRELLAIDEATAGLRAVLHRHAGEVSLCDTGSPLALLNLNTPEDYDRAGRLLREGGAAPFSSSTSSARAGNQ